MKKILIKVVSIILIISLLCSVSICVYAAGSVTYSSDSDRFIFSPGSSYSPSDLFSEYKGLMPGDSITQNITVKNDSSYNVKVKLYLRSLGSDEDSADFLSKLHLTVTKSENNEMSYMFDAAADQTAGMTDWICLGTLYSGGEVNLVLNLDIPLDLGDEYQDAIGKIDWEFKAEEFPVEPDDPHPPQTGDNSYIYLYIMFAALCVVVLLFAVHKIRKRARHY